MTTKTKTAPAATKRDTQALLDARLEKMATVADAAGWDAFASALRDRIGRRPAKAWTRDLGRTLIGDAYDPKAPQADKAARAAYLFTTRFTEDDPDGDGEKLIRRLHTDAYWSGRHLAEQQAVAK